MADAAAEQAHFPENRGEDRQRFHADAYTHRGDKYGRADAGEKLIGIARQDPVSGETA